MRKVVVSAIVVALVAWLASSAFFVVAVDSVAVLSRGGKVVRIEQPGLRWHIPFVESVGMVVVHRLYKQAVTVDAKLADGSHCQIKANILFRADDPARVLAWRLKHGLDGSAAGGRDDGRRYTEPARAFKVAAVSALRGIAPAAARSGAVSAWIRGYGAAVHTDGNRTVQVQPVIVSCELQAGREKQSTRTSSEPVFGQLKPFSETVARQRISGVKTHVLVMRPQELIMRGGRRVRFEALKLRYIVSDAARFVAAFGAGAAGHRNVPYRMESILDRHLRITIGGLDAGALASFDPLSLGAPGTPLANNLERVGIQIVDIGGDASGYRLAVARR